MRRLTDLEYISVAEAKARLSEKLRRVTSRGRRFAITSHGKPQAVLMDYKEYLSLREKGGRGVAEEMSLRDWQKRKKSRRQVVRSVSSLFDEKHLSRKGQKGYKKNAVRKMEKN